MNSPTSNEEAMPRWLSAAEQTSLFQDLTEEQRQALFGICHPRSFQQSDTLFERGQDDDTMHLILEGEVELMAGDAHVAIVIAGHCIGESTLLHSPSKALAHSLDAVARSSVETVAFTASELRDLVAQRPDIGVILYRNLAQDVSDKLRHFSE